MENLNIEHTTAATVSLDQLAPGQRGQIVHLGGSATHRRRLLEMGFVSGETIQVERVAPLGDPIAFTIKGYHFSLRRQNAAKIDVTLITEPGVA